MTRPEFDIATEVGLETGSNTNSIAALFRDSINGSEGYREFRRESAHEARTNLPSLDANKQEFQPAGIASDFAIHQPDVSLRVTRRTQSLTRSVGTSIAIFSFAGGVGKTTLAASLARLLAEQDRQVVLGNVSGSHALHHFYGPESQTIGPVTILHPSNSHSRYQLTLVEASENAEMRNNEQALAVLHSSLSSADAVLIDCQTGGNSSSAGLLSSADHILVPVVPDTHSLLTLLSLEKALQTEYRCKGTIHYIVNRYDSSRNLHRGVRDRLNSILGSALVPVCIREDQRVQDAMQAGLVVTDLAPNSEIAQDLRDLGQWLLKLIPSSIAQEGAHS